jgi:hypothetical protein
MRSFGVADVLVLLMFVLLVLDSRRLHALATGRGRREQADGIPVGGNPDQVGLTLRDIQLRRHVDWEDGALGWEGLPEILPVEEEDLFAEECEDLVAEADTTPAAAEPNRALPVLWKPFPALLPAAATVRSDCQPVSTTSSPTVTRPPATTAA